MTPTPTNTPTPTPTPIPSFPTIPPGKYDTDYPLGAAIKPATLPQATGGSGVIHILPDPEHTRSDIHHHNPRPVGNADAGEREPHDLHRDRFSAGHGNHYAGLHDSRFAVRGVGLPRHHHVERNGDKAELGLYGRRIRLRHGEVDSRREGRGIPSG